MNMRLATLAAVLFAASEAAAADAKRTTVGVVPFVTASSNEYRWIGAGIAHGLTTQFLEIKEINTLTARQLAAAVRNDNLKTEDLNDEKVVDHLAVQTGADYCVIGSYTAEWPSVTVIARIYDVKNKKMQQNIVATGNLEDFFRIESDVAKGIFAALALKGDASAAPLGTKSLYAFHEAMLGYDLLNYQSMSPRSALVLPPGAIKGARLHFEKAVQLDGKYPDAYAGLGMAQAFAADYDNARKTFAQALQLAPGGFQAQAVLGKYYTDLHSGRTDEALHGLDAGQKARPGFLHALGYLGETYNHMGRHREALSIFKRYHDICPGQPWVLVQLGYTKSKLKHFDDAITDTKQAVTMLPDSVSFQTELASRYIDADKLPDAETQLKQTIAKNPNNGKVYLRLGYVYLLEQKPDAAIPILQQALQVAQLAEEGRTRSYAHFDLARAFAMKKDTKGALGQLDDAVKSGFRDLEELESTPDLDALRGEQKYKDIVAAARKPS